MVKKVYSKNAQYQKFEVLQTNRNKRYKYGEFFVEGVRNINEAIANKWKFSSLLYADGAKLSRWAQDVLAHVKTDCNFALAPHLMQELSRKDDTSELLAVVKMRDDSFDSVPLSENPLIVLFDPAFQPREPRHADPILRRARRRRAHRDGPRRRSL